MAKMGRPKKNGTDSLSVHLAIRVTPAIDFQVKSYCRDNKVAISDFMRAAILLSLREANYHA